MVPDRNHIRFSRTHLRISCPAWEHTEFLHAMMRTIWPRTRRIVVPHRIAETFAAASKVCSRVIHAARIGFWGPTAIRSLQPLRASADYERPRSQMIRMLLDGHRLHQLLSDMELELLEPPSPFIDRAFRLAAYGVGFGATACVWLGIRVWFLGHFEPKFGHFGTFVAEVLLSLPMLAGAITADILLSRQRSAPTTAMRGAGMAIMSLVLWQSSPRFYDRLLGQFTWLPIPWDLISLNFGIGLTTGGCLVLLEFITWRARTSRSDASPSAAPATSGNSSVTDRT